MSSDGKVSSHDSYEKVISFRGIYAKTGEITNVHTGFEIDKILFVFGQSPSSLVVSDSISSSSLPANEKWTCQNYNHPWSMLITKEIINK